MQIKLKDIGGFLFGAIIAFGIISFVFAGCGRVVDDSDANNEDLNNVENIQEEQRELKIGMTGADILYLHQRLYELIPNDVTEELSIEDEFSETTQFYVTLFQLSQKIEPNGIVDMQTWNALENPTMPSEEEMLELKSMIVIDEDNKNETVDIDEKTPITGEKIAYLTFDDGPNPTYTPQIIDILKKYNAGATFFALGQEVDKFPSVIENANSNDYVFANHTYSHLDISKATDEIIENEIVKANKTVKGVTDKAPICFRPPYGAMNPDTKSKISDSGGKTIMWDVDTQDWARPGTDEIVEHVLDYTQDGEIILMHDGGGDRTQTVVALEKILKRMTADGWKFKALNCAK